MGMTLVLYNQSVAGLPPAMVATYGNRLFCDVNPALCTSVVGATNTAASPSLTFNVYFTALPTYPLGAGALGVQPISSNWFYVTCSAANTVYHPDLGLCTTYVFPGNSMVSQTMTSTAGHTSTCYDVGNSVTGLFLPVFISMQTPISQYICASYAISLGYAVSGVFNANSCYAGYSMPTTSVSTQCTLTCPGYSTTQDGTLGLANSCGGPTAASVTYYSSIAQQQSCPSTSLFSTPLGVCVSYFNLCAVVSTGNTYCMGAQPAAYGGAFAYEGFVYLNSTTTSPLASTYVNAYAFPVSALQPLVQSIQYFAYSPLTETMQDQMGNYLCSVNGFIYSGSYCASSAQQNYDGKFVVAPILFNTSSAAATAVATSVVWGLSSESFLASFVHTDANGVQIVDTGPSSFPLFIQCTAPSLSYNSTLGVCVSQAPCPPSSPSALTYACATAMWKGVGCSTSVPAFGFTYWITRATNAGVLSDMLDYTKMYQEQKVCFGSPVVAPVATIAPTQGSCPTCAVSACPTNAPCAVSACPTTVLDLSPTARLVTQLAASNSTSSSLLTDNQTFIAIGAASYFFLHSVIASFMAVAFYQRNQELTGTNETRADEDEKTNLNPRRTNADGIWSMLAFAQE